MTYSQEIDATYEEGLQDGLAAARNVRAALQALVDALAANDEDGLTEFAEPMTAARKALADFTK